MSKKSKAGKTSTAPTERDDVPKVSYAETVAEDPDFHLGTAKFEFPNGDSYEGEFCAHVSGLVWRQGRGTYTTKDGQAYVGEWDGDKLMESQDVEVTYADGSKYLGRLSQSKYSGSGIYQLEDKVSLTCTFQDNKPTGEIILVDPNRKIWHGFAEKDESLLIQEHPFYQRIGKDLGKGRSKQKPLQRQESRSTIRSTKSSRKSEADSQKSQAELKYSDLRDLEKEAFAKSKKTPSDLQLESSEWYQDYVSYCNTYGGIIHKVKTKGEGSLKHEEYDWYKKYKEFEKKYLTIMKEFKDKSKKAKGQGADQAAMFRLIHSEEYKLKNKPTRVFYLSEKRMETEEEGDSNINIDVLT